MNKQLEKIQDNLQEFLKSLPNDKYSLKHLANLYFKDLKEKDRLKIMVFTANMIAIDRKRNKEKVPYVL